MFDIIVNFLNQLDSVMYYPILIIVMAIAGLISLLRQEECKSGCLENPLESFWNLLMRKMLCLPCRQC